MHWAEREGMIAFRRDKDFSDNPYRRTDKALSAKWINGLKRAEEEKRDHERRFSKT